MSKQKLILLSILVFTLSLVGVYALAQAPNPGHSANNIGPGNFQPGGDYSFPTNVGINGTLDVGSGILTSGGISIGTGAGVNTTHLGNNTLQIVTDTSYGGTYDRHSGFLVYSIMPGGWGTAQLRFAHSEDWKTYDTENPTMVLDGDNVLVTGSMNASIYYDYNSTDYYVDPAGTSRMNVSLFGSNPSSQSAYIRVGTNQPYVDSVAIANSANYSSGIYITNACSGADCYGIYIDNSTGGVGQPLRIVGMRPSSTGAYLRIHSDGIVYYDSSSRNTKRDIKSLQDDFYKILTVQPKSFVDKASGDKEIGYIAEELDNIGLKNLVNYADGNPSGVKYEKVSLYLAEIVKNQQNKLDEQEKKNKELEARLERLENNNTTSNNENTGFWQNIFGK